MSELPGGLPNLDPAAFIGGLVQEGIGVTQGRAMLRDAGMRMSNASFSSLYGQVREAVGGRETLQAVDYAAAPSGEVYSTWTAGAGDQYATFVTTFVRRVGEAEADPVYFIHVTDDPHAPADAIAQAQGFVTEGAATNPAYGNQVVVGSVVTSVAHTVSRDQL